jgi:hypothetical protein
MTPQLTLKTELKLIDSRYRYLNIQSNNDSAKSTFLRRKIKLNVNRHTPHLSTTGAVDLLRPTSILRLWYILYEK